MASSAEIERKVRQLDNDVQSLYELLGRIEATQRRQGNRLDEIATAQAEMATTQATHGEMLSGHGEKLDAILDLLRGNQSQ